MTQLSDPPFPRSSIPGATWPAVPRPGDAYVLSLLYQMARSQWWSAEKILAHQLDQLHELVIHAHATVPFYRDRLAPLIALGRDGLTLERWRRLPLLTKRDLQDFFDALVGRALPAGHGPTVELRTSGSTGTPLKVIGSQATQAFHAAAHLRRLSWLGRDLAATAADIHPSDPGVADPPDGDIESSWATIYPTGPLVVLSVRSSAEEQVAWLKRNQPRYLISLPTVLGELAEYCERRGEQLDFLEGLGSVTEMIKPEVREICRRVFGLPVADAYSANEVGTIALQCPAHEHYHVMAEDLLVEVLDDAGAPCAPGETGRVVVTDLHNFAMPIIRYDIGDFAEAGASCPCGRGLPVINRIVGRSRNMMTLPDGRRIWPLVGMAMRLDLPARHVQIVQRDVNTLEVKIVADRTLTATDEDRFRQSITDWVGVAFDIQFAYVDSIPRGAGGKYEDFVSLVPPPVYAP
ncbi:MAG: phenylacetate--CoA ligase family protein [Alphaproteobacteria bacterium]|nr:phenylacetate--CoA ligase family protein [Alphaproteobacteria bacterium]